MTCKIVPDMTYNVFGGTLNLALSIYLPTLSALFCEQISFVDAPLLLFFVCLVFVV